ARSVRATRGQQALRRFATPARQPRADEDVPRDVGARHRVRTVEPRGLSLRKRAGLSMGQGLQVQRNPAASLAILRHRSQDSAQGGRPMNKSPLAALFAAALLVALAPV